MSLTLVQQKDSNGTGLTGTVAFTSNVAAGNLIVLKIGGGDTGMNVTSISDTRGNTYTLRSTASGNDGSSLIIKTYDAVSGSAGANTISVTVNQNGGFMELKTWEFHTTAGTWTFDQGGFSSGSADPATSGSVTTTQATEVMAGYCMIFGTNSGVYASGWTGSPTLTGDPSGYQISTSAGANAFTCGQGGSNRYAGSISTYYAAGAAPTFPVTVADTSTVSHLDFHIIGRFNLAIADTSAVAIGFHVSGSSFTVGPTTHGSSTGAYNGLTATQVTMPQDGTLLSVTINWFSDAGNNFILGVYTDNAGVPGTLLATSAVGTSVVGPQTLNMTTSPSMLNGQKYWIAVQTQTGIGGYFDTTGLGAFFSSQAWTGALPTTWGGASTGAFTFSLYATLNVGVAPKHFPMTIADTSTVAIGFHGAAIVQRFPVIVADTSTVVLGFHQLASAFTIGPTTPGNITGTYTGITATQYTMPQGGTLQSITALWFSDAGNNFLLGIYKDNAGVPGDLLATTAVAVSVIGTQTLPALTHPVMQSGQKYWIAIMTQNAIGGYYSTTSGLGAYSSPTAAWTGALPTTFPPNATGIFTFSFYATLIPGIAPFPMAIADTSTVLALGFEGAPKRFPLIVDSISTVAIGFHGATTLTLRYIKLAATGTGDGKSWTNAGDISLVNSTGAADFCFYVAGGTYPPQGFTASGSSPSHPVYVRRASATDPLCTAGAGWNSSFDAQVIFSQGVDLPANFTLDGNKWTAPGMPSTFGIKVTYPGSGGGKGIDAELGGNTIRNVEVVGPGFNLSQNEFDLIFIGANSLISGCSLHDSDALVKSWAGNSNVTLEYSWLYNVSSDIVHTHNPSVSPHPDIWYNSSGVVGLTVRWNVIANVVSEGFFFDHDNGIGGSNMLWYGNLMFQGDTQGDITNGWGAVPVEFQNNLAFGSVFFYNNTFVDWNKANYLGNGTATIDAASAFKNNLWINCDSGDIPPAQMSFNGFSAGGNGSNNTVNAASPFVGPYTPSVGATSTGTPPGTRVYPGSPGADPVGYDPSTFLNNFKLAVSSWAIGKGTNIPPFNTDMFGNTGNNLGAFQPPSGPPALHFPLVVTDTSTVSLGFHGIAPARFPLVVDDTSTVTALGFHGVPRRFPMAIADTSTVTRLNFSFPIQNFPFTIADVSTVTSLGYENDHVEIPIVPLTVPPYSGQKQQTDIQGNADIEARQKMFSLFPQLVPPNSDSTLPPG